MSQILKTFTDSELSQIGAPQTWWLILDCGHWYHWTGDATPAGDMIDCPACHPVGVQRGTDGAPR